MTDIRPKKNKSIGSHRSMQVKIDMITKKKKKKQQKLTFLEKTTGE